MDLNDVRKLLFAGTRAIDQENLTMPQFRVLMFVYMRRATSNIIDGKSADSMLRELDRKNLVMRFGRQWRVTTKGLEALNRICENTKFYVDDFIRDDFSNFFDKAPTPHDGD